MTQLRGEFAILLIVRLPEGGRLVDLEARLRRIADELELTFSLRGLTAVEVRAPERTGLTPCLVTVFGADHPGIVAAVKKAAAAGPSLEEMSPQEMLEHIEAIREIMEFSDQEKEIRVMCEQSSIPKCLVDIAVSEPDRLDVLEKEAEG